jgi:hypothetical protein
MTTKKKDSMPETEGVPDEENEAVAFDLKDMYSFDPKDAVPEISSTRYSNLAYINVSHRDVYIDFLEMPGIKRDGKMFVQGIRIYLSHVAAQKLTEALGGILENVHAKGSMEKYHGKEEHETKSD